jgi:hypothetical protein
MSRSSAPSRSPVGERRPGSPSPPSRQPCHRDGGRQTIVERVVGRSTTGIVYPMLTRTNYTEWSLVMHANLQAAGLWEAVHYDNVEYHNDGHALAVLLRTVPAEMHARLTNKESASEAW